MNEEWRAVIGFEGIYEVSSLGRLRSVDRLDARGYRQRGKLLSPAPDLRGYPVAHLRKNRKNIFKKLHHLVCFAFLGPPPGPICIGPGCWEVNHKDGNKANAAVTNLEYVTRKENAIHAVKSGLRVDVGVGERNGRSKLTETQVRLIRKLYADGDYTLCSLGKKFGVGKSSIGYIVNGDTWRHVQ